MEIGSAVHGLVLHDDRDIVWIDAPDFKTNAAKSLRAEAQAAGAIALLRKHEDRVNDMVDAIAAVWKPPANSLAECSIVWREGPAWCRSRLDCVRPTYPLELDDLVYIPSAIIYDLKLTGLDATPEGWGKWRIWEYLMQVGFYRRAYRSLWPDTDPAFIFVVQENKAPYGVQRFRFDAAGVAIADQMADAAIKLWTQCVTTDKWPSYPTGQDVVIETPGWRLQKD